MSGMNAASMLKLMSARNQFNHNHPKFGAFLKAVFSRQIEEGTVIEPVSYTHLTLPTT